MYCASWFMTLYSGAWPVDLVARIWDVFFCGGTDIFHRVALTFIKLYKCKKPLLNSITTTIARFEKLPFEEIIMYTRTPWEKVSPEELLRTSLSMSSVEKNIQVIMLHFNNIRHNNAWSHENIIEIRGRTQEKS